MTVTEALATQGVFLVILAPILILWLDLAESLLWEKVLKALIVIFTLTGMVSLLAALWMGVEW